MSTPAEQNSESSSRQRASSECKPLIDAATRDLFRKNAFRIIGLPVHATTRDVAKHSDKLKMLAELGQDPHTQGAAFPMQPPPTLDEIREAIQKLKDPEMRLIDEFFWFWPEDFADGKSDPAMQALAKGDSKTAIEIWTAKENDEASGITSKHNLALVYYVCALDWENFSIKNEVEAERRQKIADYWQGTTNRWACLALDERLWEKVTARIRQLNEPSLATGFARRMRETLPDALDKINAEFAVAFAESGKIEFARVHIEIMRKTHQGLHNVEKTAERVLAPTRNRLKEQIQCAKDRAEKTPSDGAKAARDLLEQARQNLTLFDLFFGKNNESRNDLFDEVATACNRLQVIYHDATSDDKTCLDVLNSVLPLANSIELRQQIEKNIGVLSGFIADKKLEPAYALLKSIQDSKEHPRTRLERFTHEVVNLLNGVSAGLPHSSNSRNQLFDSAAIVLRGISLDAWNANQDRATAVAANELAIKYAISSDLKQRVADDRATLQKLGMQMSVAASAQRAKSKNSGMGCLVVVAIFIVLGIIGTCNSPNSASTNSSYSSPSPPSTPAYTPQQPANGNSDGNAYRLPNSADSILHNERAQIELDRTALETLEAQVENLGREIESDRISLDRSSQFAVDEFNEKVGRYNDLSQRAKTANAAFNDKVDNYNAKLRQ
jgi:hypothetical protein